METSDLKRYMKPNFPDVHSIGDRPWGTEDLLVLVPGKFMIKRLFIKAGSKGGVQYHRRKDEAGVLISGHLIVRHDDGNGNLVESHIWPGESFHFPPGVVHQEEAVTDCIIIEGSTPHFNDRVRVEALYNLRTEGGLPTTHASEIEEK